jgi:hypothetical protein
VLGITTQQSPRRLFKDVHPVRVYLFCLLYHRNLEASQPSGSRDPTPPLLSPAQARLSFGSGLLTLFTRRGAVKTHLIRNGQLLTRGPKGVPPKARGPEFVTTPLPSSLPSSLPSLRSLSHLFSKDLSFSFPLQIFTSAHAEFCIS